MKDRGPKAAKKCGRIDNELHESANGWLPRGEHALSKHSDSGQPLALFQLGK
jgi:hypothetical protein